MSTPYTFLAGWIKTVVASFWFVWLSTLIVSRIYVFHQAYVSETQKRADERYLLDKCNDPEFYSNIRQHTEICTHVAENAKSSLILKALHLMSQTTYLCGDRACAEVVRTTLARLTWQAAVSLGFLALIFPNALLAFSRLLGQKRQIWMQEQDLIRRRQSKISPYYENMEFTDEDPAASFRKRKPFVNSEETVKMV